MWSKAPSSASPSTAASQGLATFAWKLRKQHSTIEVGGAAARTPGRPGVFRRAVWGGRQPPPGSQDVFSAAVEDYLLPTRLEVPSFAPPAQLAPTIYPSEEGVTERGTSGRKGQGPPMLSAAVRIHLDPHKNVKVQAPRLLTHMRDLGNSSSERELGSHPPD